ncbi:imelysin family protein [uncultured Thalassolituus sp.]|uniref:imelysin family protein n=1 Tax=uncultured Thalassolituus sp. TaxID=285273 RepID=UPI002604D929|nr:imelysin family protein [uncultured Thalassolituus sp.]
MKLNHLAIGVATAVFLTACGGGSNSSNDDATNGLTTSGELNLDNVRSLLDTNADIALAAYNDSVATAEELQDALASFRADPSEANLEAAKKAWLVAREPYGQTEVYRFRLSPIDSTDYDSEDGLEGDINAWPLGEALIDYVQVNTSDFGDDQIGVTANGAGVNGGGAVDSENFDDTSPKTNIIGNTSIVIDQDLLSNTATADDEHDVIAGYHAIEFLLWGQDLNDSAGTTDGTDRDEAVKTEGASNYAAGGDRPLGDFIPSYDADTASGNDDVDASYDSSVESHRRHKYLEVAVEKLIADLKSVRDGWVEGATYRTAFTTISSQAEAREKLAEILTGMGTLSEGELAGERMQIAFSGNSQEDEHSCFSDNTHRDIWLNAEGVSNSYYGTYAGYDSTLDGTDNETASAVNGYGFDDLLASMGELQLKSQIETALSTTAAYYTEIDTAARNGSPFDVQIMAENRTSDSSVAKTIVALNAQSKIIANIAEALDISGSVVDEEASGCDTESPTESCD